MARDIIFKNENLLLEYVSEGNYLHETWWGLTPTPKFLELLDIIIQALEEKQADGLLLDAREHLGITQKDRDIAAKRHSDYASNHGILKQAIMIPKDYFSAHSVKNYAEQFKEVQSSNIMYFTEISDAENWLKDAGDSNQD